jgi:hypothetical protein
MEHRWSARRPVIGNVIVECPRIGLVRAALRDISLGGMLVETSAVMLPLNAPVSVVFDLRGDDGNEGYCLQAMIVRHATRGAGIMFLDPGSDVIRSMRDTLYGETPAMARRAEAAQGTGRRSEAPMLRAHK